ncbi:Homeobox domain protein [Kalmanozyma brasiliensis GHG001]|uniref:Homeobox domain-containing protein n=1 Tax=Kalmanozyma brasiliensis (strain GHG001) TaxID=1365824 RepID=V5EZC1_KALBG|nr:Homeobox domain protein [Kalmanozyma brasiliensis GHG001]EST09243.1 Homeobox domain protein [Kalmanozyma brasiliensis GHG001]
MSQRPQRAAALQATRATAAVLSSHRRSDPQASTIANSPSLVKSEQRGYEDRKLPPMDIDMQRSAHQDLRRLDPMGHSLASVAGYDSANGSYGSDAFQTYWSSQDHSSAAAHAAIQEGSSSSHQPPQKWEATDSQPHSTPRYDSVNTHNIFDLHYPYGPQGNSLGLKGASGLNAGLNGDLDLADSMHRSHRALDAPSSQALALIDSLPFKASSSGDNDSYEDSTDSDLPPEKKKLSAAFRPRGRKKRNKCTPDQLRSLEAFFEKNRNPTGRIRHELSRKLRMPERSVQVWFQNRRAKLKVVEQRGETALDSSRKKSCSIQLSDRDTYKAASSAGRSARDVIDEKPSVTAMPTSALCIGTWRRVSPLICFFSRRMQSLTWYLTSESIGFKLEVPWTAISAAYFDGPKEPTIAERAEGVRVPLGQFVIDLERPPTFFMEVFRSAPAKNGSAEEPRVSWRQCEDFTEDHQAMTVSRHILNGPYEELRSAVQSLAACNEVLRNLIQFRDQDLRAAGAIPTGTGSTADNFGVVNNVDYRSAGPSVPSLDMSPALPGVDMYGHGMQMPMQATAMSSSSSLQKSAAWNHFRTPMRLGAEHNWEFDSPASVTTNLSDASLDSHQRHPLGYSPYGVPTSIEASPRSGLGSSMDLNTLRIDAAGMSTANYAAAGNMTLMSDGSMNGSRAHLGGWDSRLSYDASGSQHMDAQHYSLASSSILPGATQPSSHFMQSLGSLHSAGMDTSNAMSYSRYAGERQDCSAQSMNEHGMDQHQHQHHHHTGESNFGTSYPQENPHGVYDHREAPSDPSAIHSGSVLMSRRFSHAEGAYRGDYPQDVGENETRPSSQGGRPSSASQLSVKSMASTANAKISSFEEDAFSAKTPTHRTSFGNLLQLSHINGQDQSVYADRHAIDASSLPTARAADSSFEDENTAQGRARSNTYRPSTHGGGRVAGLSSPMQRSDQDQDQDQDQDAEGEYVGADGHKNDDGDDDGDSLSEDDAEGSCDEDEGTGKRCATAATEAESPGLLSLSSKHPDSPVPQIEELP